MLGDPGTCRATGLCGLPCKSWRQWETLCRLTQVSVALERDLLKYLSNAEAVRIKYLLGFYFPPLWLVLLGASVLVGLIHEHLQKQNSIIYHMYSPTSFSKAPPPGHSCSSLQPPTPRHSCARHAGLLRSKTGRWDLNPGSLASEFMLLIIKIYYLLILISSISLSQFLDTLPSQV